MNDLITSLDSLTAAIIDFTPTAVPHAKPNNQENLIPDVKKGFISA